MTDKFYFRCKSNPKGPYLVLENYWEAVEMRGHPDYERVNELGVVIAHEEDQAPQRIPFAPPTPAVASEKKPNRPVLTTKRKAA